MNKITSAGSARLVALTAAQCPRSSNGSLRRTDSTSSSSRRAPAQQPGDNEVLVKILAVSLNYRDTEVANGLYTHHQSLHGDEQQPPLVPCSDMCGVISAVGAKVSRWKVGDRVLSTLNQTHLTGQVTGKELASGLGLPLSGVLATYRVFPEYGLVAASGVSERQAGVYAADCECDGVDVAVLAVSVGAGWSTRLPGRKWEIAKAAGYKVIITSSSDDKLATARKLGADHTINYRTQPDWHNEVLRLTIRPRRRRDFRDLWCADPAQESVVRRAWGGMVACIGYLSGKDDTGLSGDQTNINVLALRRNATLKGILNGPRDRFEKMNAFYEKHRLRPVIDRVFPFEEGKQALQYLASGSHFGKVVVEVSH